MYQGGRCRPTYECKFDLLYKLGKKKAAEPKKCTKIKYYTVEIV